MDKLRGLRILAGVFAILILAVAVSPAAVAAEEEITGVDGLRSSLPREAREVLDGGAGSDVAGTLEKTVTEAVRKAFQSSFRAALATAVAVLAAAMICSVAGGLAGERERGVDYVNLIGVFVVAACAAGSLTTLIGEARALVEDLTELGTMILPVLASCSAVSGAAATGAAKYAASALFMGVLGTLAKKLIVPLIYMYLAASLGQAAFGGSGGVAGLIQKLIKHALTVAVLGFTIYISTVSLIASSADAVTVKLTKTAISTLLPVVGGMVADASDALASGVGILKGAVGAAGVVAVISICAAPVLKLILNSALFSAASMLAETVAPKPLTSFIGAVSTACSLMLALAGTEAAILAISIISAAKAVGG